MNALLLLWMLSVPAGAELPCRLTPYDMESLAKSKSRIASLEQAESLPDHERRRLCLTRREVNKLSDERFRDSPLHEILTLDNPYLRPGELNVIRMWQAGDKLDRMLDRKPK
ncbi:MAG: hypothetical protein HY549_11930 [Elusimicrobia bacterium]|nr:hypothetical protein [Elusimicrobiota bacterium]